MTQCRSAAGPGASRSRVGPAAPRSARARQPPSPARSSSPQLLEHDGIDRVESVHALLEVLVPGPAGERLGELAVVAQPRELLAQLAGELRVDLDPLRPGRLAEDRVVEAVQPRELVDRTLVVVDTEVDEDVRELAVAAVALDHEERRRLLAPRVPARRLRGREAFDQALRERRSRGGLEGRRERVDGRFGDEDVALGGVARAGPPACPRVALAARVGRAAAGRVDDAELAMVAVLVGLGQP